MALYVPQLNFNKFRRGEVVDIDESEWTNVIERGWLKKFDEGLLSAPLVMPVDSPLPEDSTDDEPFDTDDAP